MGLVAMKVWMRGRGALSRARAARSMSPGLQRASAATVTPLNSLATLPTASKSPSEAIGKPASSTSTPRSTSCFAIRSFSATVMLQPHDCSPSRRVVSKTNTRSEVDMGRRTSSFKVVGSVAAGIRFHEFIMLCVTMRFAYAISVAYREATHHMDLHVLQVFRAVATEKSFSRAAVKLGRTQPAISLAVQRLDAAAGEPLIDRSAKELRLTDAGGLVLDYARRFDNLREELGVALA